MSGLVWIWFVPLLFGWFVGRLVVCWLIGCSFGWLFVWSCLFVPVVGLIVFAYGVCFFLCAFFSLGLLVSLRVFLGTPTHQRDFRIPGLSLGIIQSSCRHKGVIFAKWASLLVVILFVKASFLCLIFKAYIHPPINSILSSFLSRNIQHLDVQWHPKHPCFVGRFRLTHGTIQTEMVRLGHLRK